MSQLDGSDPYSSGRATPQRSWTAPSASAGFPAGADGVRAGGFGEHASWEHRADRDPRDQDPREQGSRRAGPDRPGPDRPEPSWQDEMDAAERAWQSQAQSSADRPMPPPHADQPSGAAPHAEPEQQHGRAGRNVPVSIAVGVGLLTVVLIPLFFAKPVFIAIVAVAAGVGIWEMTRAVRSSGAKPPLIPLLGGSAAMFALAWFSGLDGLSIGLLISVLAIMVWRMGDGPIGYQRDMGAAALIAVYVPFLLGFAVPLTRPDDGAWRIVVTLAAVVLSDTGGFVAGVLFGKHPMAPTISPKKSWEGFAGSMVAAAIGSAVLLAVLLDVAPWWGAVFGLVIAVSAVLGDLAESLLKRDLGIKDMSNLLPGHGGLMDRLDSILFAVPTAYLLLSVLAPPA